jgi:two-component system, OmpR family, sensor kinase
MASLGSYTRSAARATSSAYRRLPIRWRVAGGSAALTLVILCAFAAVVGALTTRRLNDDFQRETRAAANDLQRILDVRYAGRDSQGPRFVVRPDLDAYVAGRQAVARIVYGDDTLVRASEGAPDFGPPRGRTQAIGGWRVETREVPLRSVAGPGTLGTVYVQYARRVADVRDTISRVELFLVTGVLAGALLALLAGLATARRAMRPIRHLTDTARTIEYTRDPSVRITVPEADDEIAELAETMAGMLRSLDQARGESEAALSRQREFVADASHELRTPLTAVLANLELLEEALAGDERDAAAAALRSARRMRLLVGDLLLLARADTGEQPLPRERLYRSEVVGEAAAELRAAAGDHPFRIEAEPGAEVLGAREDLHRLVVNLLENALRHTDRGTRVEATVEQRDGRVVLAVEDDGPGIPPELRDKVFERFYRGAGERSGSTGLGLSIVRAVAEAHRGTVELTDPRDGRGARFVVTLPACRPGRTST